MNVADLGLGHDRELAQVGDGFVRLVARHRGTGTDQSGRGSDREIPIDHLPGVAGSAALLVMRLTVRRSPPETCPNVVYAGRDRRSDKSTGETSCG